MHCFCYWFELLRAAAVLAKTKRKVLRFDERCDKRVALLRWLDEIGNRVCRLWEARRENSFLIASKTLSWKSRNSQSTSLLFAASGPLLLLMISQHTNSSSRSSNKYVKFIYKIFKRHTEPTCRVEQHRDFQSAQNPNSWAAATTTNEMFESIKLIKFSLSSRTREWRKKKYFFEDKTTRKYVFN